MLTQVGPRELRLTVGVQLEACDGSTAGSAQLNLNTSPLNGVCTTAATIDTGFLATPGCQAFNSGPLTSRWTTGASATT